MKRLVIYLIIIAAVVAAPVRPLNVDQLLPVQVVSVYKEGTRSVIETDTGNKGVGDTVSEALQNLKDTASGTVYLKTAEYLLITQDTIKDGVALLGELRASARMCETVGRLNLEEVAQYLNAHTHLPKVKAWKKGAELPILGAFENSLIFLKKVENNA